MFVTDFCGVARATKIRHPSTGNLLLHAFLPERQKMSSPRTGSVWDPRFGGFALFNILWH